MPYSHGLCAAVLLAAAPLGFAQVQYEVLPSASEGLIWPWAVSNDARTVIGDFIIGSNGKAGWSRTIGTRRITPDVSGSIWPFVGASSDLTTFAWVSGGGSPNQAVRQSASGNPQLLPLPAGPVGDVRVHNLSANGDFVAGSYTPNGGAPVPLIWDAAGLVTIPYPEGAALAVSDDGLTSIIQRTVSPSLRESFYISPQTGVTSISATLPPGSNLSQVVDMSGDGAWVIGTIWNGTTYRSYRWSVATGPLFIESPAIPFIRVTAISDDGSTIVGSSLVTGPATSGTIFWTASTGVVHLESFLVSNGISPTQTPDHPQGVSADGRTIVGGSPVLPYLVSLGAAARDEVGTGYCGPAVPHSAGASATCRLIGTPIVWANDLTVEANDMPPNRFGIFVTSDQMGFVTQPGSSAGNLCLSGAIGRYSRPGEIQQSDASGTFSLDLDLPTTPTVGGIVPSIMAGDTRFFQAWFRDVTPATASNFTSGVSVTFR